MRAQVPMLLTGTVIPARRSFVQDQLSERTRIVGVPDGVHDLARCGKKRPRLSEQRVVALVDPAKSVSGFGGARRLADRLAVREPRQVHAARDRQTDPFPDTGIDVEKQMLLSRRVPDELNLADPVVAEGFQNRASALDDLGDLLADDEASGAEAFRILLELSSDERAAELAIRRDVRAERVEAAGWHVDDLLGDAREIRRLAREAHELCRVLSAEHFHAEPVVEAPLLGGLHDRRVADPPRGERTRDGEAGDVAVEDEGAG